VLFRSLARRERNRHHLTTEEQNAVAKYEQLALGRTKAMNIFSIDGHFIEEDKAVIEANDLSVLRGYGIFDFTRTYNGQPFHLHDHLRRLEQSARLLGMVLPRPLSQIDEIVRATLAKNSHTESNVRIVVTGGVSSDGITPQQRSRLLVMITPAHEMERESFTTGTKVITCHQERYLPGAKTISYIPAILSQQEAKSRQAIEAIYVDRDGYLLEGTTSNFFGVIGKKIITAPVDRILPGVTRKVVLELAWKEYPVEQRKIHLDELWLLDEAFLTSSTREVTPIVKVDNIAIGNGVVGEVSKRLMQLLNQYTKNYRDR
jgi:branched-chain amino acid aminotransferase